MTHFSRRLRRITCLLAALALFGIPVGVAAAATHHGNVPRSHYRFTAAIEDMPPYQPEKFCRNSLEPGVKRFEKTLTRTWPSTRIVSDLRPCVKGVTSEHYDGRALDWGVDYRNKKQRAIGKAFLAWLFATDRYGNHDAMLRRTGIMYIIWNHRIWGTWDQRWDPYQCKGVTACHVDHMHLSFDWAGAEAKTSWFSGKVSGYVGYPPHSHPKKH